MRKLTVWVVSMTLFIAVSSAHAEFYSWVDGNGREFFTNDLKKVPPEYQGAAKRIDPDASRVSIGTATAGSLARASRGEGEHRDKYGHGEAYWHARASKLYAKLHDLEDEHQRTLAQINQEETHAKKPGKGKKRSEGLEKRKLKIEKELAKVHRALDVDLPTEARKADAYPGWIRE